MLGPYKLIKLAHAPLNERLFSFRPHGRMLQEAGDEQGTKQRETNGIMKKQSLHLLWLCVMQGSLKASGLTSVS